MQPPANATAAARFRCSYRTCTPCALTRHTKHHLDSCMSPDSDLNTLLAFPQGFDFEFTLTVAYFEQSSFITVAGPCRIHTCFHLSSVSARTLAITAIRRTQTFFILLLIISFLISAFKGFYFFFSCGRINTL